MCLILFQIMLKLFVIHVNDNDDNEHKKSLMKTEIINQWTFVPFVFGKQKV